MWCVGGKLNTRTKMCGYYSGWIYTGDKGGVILGGFTLGIKGGGMGVNFA